MVALAAGSEGELERFQELASAHEFEAGQILFLPIPASRGFTYPAAKLAVLADAELFGRSAFMRQRRIAMRRERVHSGRAAMDFTEFEPGDYVVHIEHGIAAYEGLVRRSVGVGLISDDDRERAESMKAEQGAK